MEVPHVVSSALVPQIAGNVSSLTDRTRRPPSPSRSVHLWIVCGTRPVSRRSV